MDEVDSRGIEWRQLDDDVRLAGWRTERLLVLGNEPQRAASLAISEIDIHEVERLIGKGCPPKTAIPIAA